jgi:hypothetical protein
VGFAVFGAVAAYFLLSEHRAHFLGSLPFLLLLACPLMHLFMRGGHGGHAGHGGRHGAVVFEFTPDCVAVKRLAR